jgi:predicted phage baseplate assembly protein
VLTLRWGSSIDTYGARSPSAPVARPAAGKNPVQVARCQSSVQRPTLRQPRSLCDLPPSGDVPRSSRSTIALSSTFLRHGPTERIYITRTDDDGKTTVQFGDGKTGARLPTGQNNVLAAYRQGIGSAGLVRAGQLGLLMTRPLGVREVTNPLDATGAADPESGDDIRQNAPLTLRTLDRIVSLQDYEDFARAFSGITKALATWTWNGQQQGVLITVAGPDRPSSLRHDALLTSLLQSGFGDRSFLWVWPRVQPSLSGARSRSASEYTRGNCLASC